MDEFYSLCKSHQHSLSCVNPFLIFNLLGLIFLQLLFPFAMRPMWASYSCQAPWKLASLQSHCRDKKLSDNLRSLHLQNPWKNPEHTQLCRLIQAINSNTFMLLANPKQFHKKNTVGCHSSGQFHHRIRQPGCCHPQHSTRLALEPFLYVGKKASPTSVLVLSLNLHKCS